MNVINVRVLADRYELGAMIGSGGMADVFRATDRILQRTVAIKMLRPGSVVINARERFATEAHTLASLNHPGVVTLLDAGIFDEYPYLVMEFVDGPSLSEEIRVAGPMDPGRVALIGAQVAEALGFAHENDVVHRDVKPGNILLTDEDRALLTDFGIARLLTDDAHFTKADETIGSPAYLSPEQVNAEPLTEAADVYSLGLVLLEALTAVRAYPGTPIEAAVARLSATPAIPTSLDTDWRDLLQQMTERRPADRPSAPEVAARLNASLNSTAAVDPVSDLGANTGAFELPDETAQITAVAEENFLVRLPVPVRRSRPRKLWLAAGCAAAAVLVAAGAFVLLKPPEPVVAPTYRPPVELPQQMQQPLSDLHHAVDQAQR